MKDVKPTVTLLSWTDKPVRTLTSVWNASRSSEPLEKLVATDHDLFQKVIDSKIPVAEMVDFVFILEDVSVAFREQLVRHRIGMKYDGRVGMDTVPELPDSTFWAQSMRVLDMSDFDYQIPDSVEHQGGPALLRYRNAMTEASSSYCELLDKGIPEEDARMVIPLAACHRVAWKVNLAALIHVIGKRGCWILQIGFWGPIIEQVVQELVEKVDPVFSRLITPPCMTGETFNACLFKLDNEKRIQGDDPLPPCPLYLNHHRDEARDVSERSERGDCWQYSKEHKRFFTYDENKTAQNAFMRSKFAQLWRRDVDTGVSVDANP